MKKLFIASLFITLTRCMENNTTVIVRCAHNQTSIACKEHLMASPLFLHHLQSPHITEFTVALPKQEWDRFYTFLCIAHNTSITEKRTYTIADVVKRSALNEDSRQRIITLAQAWQFM